MATTNVSVTIDEDLLKAIHAMRGDVSLSRYLSNLALREALESGYKIPSQKTMIAEPMFE